MEARKWWKKKRMKIEGEQVNLKPHSHKRKSSLMCQAPPSMETHLLSLEGLVIIGRMTDTFIIQDTFPQYTGLHYLVYKGRTSHARVPYQQLIRPRTKTLGQDASINLHKDGRPTSSTNQTKAQRMQQGTPESSLGISEHNSNISISIVKGSESERIPSSVILKDPQQDSDLI